MQTFFTSDTHFDDKYAIQYFNRPFKSMDEMNVVMVEKWNSVVTENDTVYHLGDFTLDDIYHFTKWVSQLRGNIKILPGSHDHLWLKDSAASAKVQVVAPLVSVEFPELSAGKLPQVVVLCHYSMQVWDRSNHGSWHLFGHSHGKLKGIGLSFDVGVDCTEFTPLSLEAVAAKMAYVAQRGASPSREHMKLTGLDHIVLCVADVERTLAFYQEALGMQPREDRPGKWSLHFGANKISLQDARTAPDIGRDTVPGNGNFCVLTDDPIERVVAVLHRLGIDIVAGPAEREGATGKLLSVYFRDPDGNLVEVSNRL